MRPRLYSPIARIGIRPDEPADGPGTITGPRPRGRRWLRTDAEVAAVRRLVEQTALTYDEIERRTGVGRTNISRWKIDGDWQRPPFAPRAKDAVPTARASAKLKRRTLAKRLDALAERHVRELEASACVDPDKLAGALELLKMARLAASPRRKGLRGEWMRPIIELCAAGVELPRAPHDAVEDFLANRAPPAVKPPLQRRSGRRPTRNAHHAWMLEKERP